MHSTSASAARRIERFGYDLGHDGDDGSAFAYSFASIVPDTYPNATEINKAALSYRYMSHDTKLVFQFPFSFPKTAFEKTAKMVVGHTPLGRYEAVKSGLIVEHDGSWYIPPKFIAGSIDFENKQTDLLKPARRSSLLRRIGQKVISNA